MSMTAYYTLVSKCTRRVCRVPTIIYARERGGGEDWSTLRRRRLVARALTASLSLSISRDRKNDDNE